jgi:drug/metabolite transporter superfamily protein YnfA
MDLIALLWIAGAHFLWLGWRNFPPSLMALMNPMVTAAFHAKAPGRIYRIRGGLLILAGLALGILTDVVNGFHQH